MRLEQLLSGVDAKWHEAFIGFVTTGEVEEDFLDFLDKNEACQDAVDAAFRVQSQGLERLARAMADDRSKSKHPLEAEAKGGEAIEEFLAELESVNPAQRHALAGVMSRYVTLKPSEQEHVKKRLAAAGQ